MAVNLKGRSFLTLMDFSTEEIRYMLDLAHELKAKKKAGVIGDLLKGKKATCYPGFEGELRGAEIVDAGVVTDGNITTARGMGVALDFAEELINICLGKEKADEISKAICR